MLHVSASQRSCAWCVHLWNSPDSSCAYPGQPNQCADYCTTTTSWTGSLNTGQAGWVEKLCRWCHRRLARAEASFQIRSQGSYSLTSHYKALIGMICAGLEDGWRGEVKGKKKEERLDRCGSHWQADSMTFPPVSCCENLHSRPQEKHQALFGSSSTAQRGDDEQCIHLINQILYSVSSDHFVWSVGAHLWNGFENTELQDRQKNGVNNKCMSTQKIHFSRTCLLLSGRVI